MQNSWIKRSLQIPTTIQSVLKTVKCQMKVLLKDLLTAYKYGLKTLYYQNTRDGAEDSQEDLDDGCAGGACKI